jgi:AbrB family looped-hinge helix DNA binding protein
MVVGITQMNSKGQIVIPASMRKDLLEGEKLLLIRESERIILKPLGELKPALQEDILFAEKKEQAFEEYKKGTFTRKKEGTFIDELSSW